MATTIARGVGFPDVGLIEGTSMKLRQEGLARKLGLIIMPTVSISLLPSTLHASGRFRGGRSNVPLGFFIVELGSAITGGSPHFTAAAASHVY